VPVGRCRTGPAGTGRATAYPEDRDRSGDGGARSRGAGWEDYGGGAGTECGARPPGGGGRRTRRRGGSGPSRRIRSWGDRHDATEAFELAERQEREIEAEYEAWKLLLDQMKEADAAQASNLGQALGPAIAGRFQELTQRRYEAVQLTAQLATEGVVVSGALRPATQISIGTREQLSTLYRLSLAEYLRTAIVLDDQLVQSDDNRMDWFRALLTEKARCFQIIVFTCRPSDYLLVTHQPGRNGARRGERNLKIGTVLVRD
jgi:hypothetical protein